jgi:hypothetical protein
VAPIEQIDKSKNWFVSVVPNSWNWESYTGDFISGFAEEVQHELLHGNAYLIINHECESFTFTFFKEIHNKLANSKLSPSKVIYMVGAMDVQREYDRFVAENKIFNHQHITLMSSCHVYKRLDYPLKFFKYDYHAKKEKKFLSLNRTGRDHRIMLVSLLAYYDLLDVGFVSLGVFPQEIVGIERELLLQPALDDRILKGFDQIKPKLPLKVDDIDLRVNQFKPLSLPSSFYEKSYFSVVSSTFALKTREPSVGFTEKEIKPILYRHPFIIYNLPGALKHLRSMGFLTFDKWFDESYDCEIDDNKRLSKIVNEIQRLSLIPNSKWDIMLEEMQPILLHNYNRLVKYNTEHCFFNSDLKNFLYYVT